MKEFLSELKDSKYIVPLALFVFSFFVRISLISKGPYSLDTLLVVEAALQTIKTNQLQYFQDFQYPLAVIVLVGFIKFFRIFSIEAPVYLYNFISVLFSSVSVAFFYVLIKQLLNKSTAFFAAILLSLCPIYLGLSVYGTSNVLSLFFLFLCLISLNQYFISKENKYYLISAFSLGLLGAARLQEMFFILPAVFCLFVFSPFTKKGIDGEKQKRLRASLCSFVGYFFVALFIGALFYLPAILRYVKYPAHPFLVKVLVNNVPRSGFIKYFINSLFRNIGFIKASCSLLGFSLSLVGLVWMLFSEKRMFYLCFFWIMVPLIILTCFRITGPRLLVLTVPPFFVGLGYVLSNLSKKNKWVRFVVFAVFIGIMFSNYFKIYPILLHRHNNALLPDYARKIGEISNLRDVIICHDEALFIKYYAKRKTIVRPSERDLFNKDVMMKYKDDINKILGQGNAVYSTWPGMYSSAHPQVFEYLINKYFIVEEIGMMPYEDWHRGPTRQQIYNFPVYRLKKKASVFR